MIKVNFGMVEISGSTKTILADLSCITCAIETEGLNGIDTKEQLKKEVLQAVEKGFDEEAAEDAVPVDLGNILASLFRDLANDLEKGKGEE